MLQHAVRVVLNQPCFGNATAGVDLWGMNRIDRLTAILIQLQGRRVVKARDIAERFDITLRTVYRDIQALSAAGVPVIGEAGVGYTLMEGYRLPPVLFTTAEATAFLTAEKFMDNFSDADTATSYRSGMHKIRAVLRTAEKDYLETIENNIHVLPDPWLPAGRYSGLQDILRSIAGKYIIHLSYSTTYTHVLSDRKVEPVGVFHRGSYWYLIAYCHLRAAYRNFRLDQVQAMRVLDEQFSKAHPTLQHYLEQVVVEKEMHKVVLLIDAEAEGRLGDQKYYCGFVSQQLQKDKLEMTFLTASLDGFARWYLMIGDIASIVSPEALRIKANVLLARITQKMK